MASSIVYEDRWGEVIDRPDADYIEIRWYDATSDLDSDTFNRWLSGFAGAVEAAGRSGILVDSVVFGMPMADMDWAYRDTQVIPRYNAAGVAKFAFILPAGSPPIGAATYVDGPAEYPTAYFGSRADAVAWLGQ